MKLFHTLLYPLLGLLFLSCSDNEQETGDNPAPTTGTITFGVDLTGFTPVSHKTVRLGRMGTRLEHSPWMPIRPSRYWTM